MDKRLRRALKTKESLGLIVLFVPMVSFALLIYGFV